MSCLVACSLRNNVEKQTDKQTHRPSTALRVNGYLLYCHFTSPVKEMKQFAEEEEVAVKQDKECDTPHPEISGK